MELFESLAQALKPPRVEVNNKVTYCRNCMIYRDDKGNEIPQRYALQNCVITNRFCNKDCYKEFNQ